MPNVKIPQLPPLNRNAVAGDQVPIWDGERAITVYADVTQLPGNGGGGVAEAVTNPSPFLVFTNSTNYFYDAPSNTTTIKDVRLLNKTLYPVYSKQLNTEFGVDEVTYQNDPDDPTLGELIIPNFQLDDDSHISITVPGSTDTSGDTTYKNLLADVALLKLICAPFMNTALGPNGGKVLWGAPAYLIPPGWQEWVDIRGKIPIPQDPNDIYDATNNPEGMSRDLGTEGGSRYHTNTIGEMVPHGHSVSTTNTKASNSDGADPVRGIEGGSVNSRGLAGTGKTIGITGGVPDPVTRVPAPQPFSIMNKYRIVEYIEFVGV